MANNGKHKPSSMAINTSGVLSADAWEAALMQLVGDGITKGIPEAEMIAALEKSKLGLIMAHTVSTVERRAKKKN